MVVTEGIGILGALMVVGAFGYLWLSRLSAKHVQTEAHDNSDHLDGGDTNAIVSPYKVQLGQPDFAPKPRADTKVTLEIEEAELVVAAESAAPAEESTPDCQDAQVNLFLATKMKLIGDIEGVRELAQVVVASSTASKKQKQNASALIRQVAQQ